MSCFETLKSISTLKKYIIEYEEISGNVFFFTYEELQYADSIMPFFSTLNEGYE